MSDLGIATLLDLGELENVLMDFSEATGLATVAVDPRGVPVTDTHAFSDFCRQMRADPVRNQACHACDAHGGLQSLIDGSPQVYTCHAGLVDFSVPVTEGDTYVGAILCGQVRVPDAQWPRQLTARTEWRGDPTLEALYDQLPLSPLRRVAAAAKTLFGLSRMRDGVALMSRRRDKLVIPPVVTESHPVVSLQLLPLKRPEPLFPPAVDSHAALRAAIDAEDLAGAFAEATRLLDLVYRGGGDVQEGIARVEDLVIAVVVERAPRLVPHLTQSVERHRGRRFATTNRFQAQLHIERLLSLVLDEVVRSRPPRRTDLRDVLNDIARHPNRPMSLTEAAAMTHWSPGHLSKLFRSVTGCTFVSYVTAGRISRAQLMLASTQMPVQKIAAELNFHQVNYFSRVFRAHTGVTPSEFRRQCSSRDGRPDDVSLSAHHHALLRA